MNEEQEMYDDDDDGEMPEELKGLTPPDPITRGEDLVQSILDRAKKNETIFRKSRQGFKGNKRTSSKKE